MPLLFPYNASQQGRARGLRRRDLSIYFAFLLGLLWMAYTIVNGCAHCPTVTKTQVSPMGKHEYASNPRPTSEDVIQILDLPTNLLPKIGEGRHSGRLIIVGDVHGMLGALVDLLVKTDFNEKQDHLILAGDMISKGPDSLGVVDLAMKLGATSVRGNHEDRIILTHADMVAKHAVMGGSKENEWQEQDALEDDLSGHRDNKDMALVKALGEKRINWLKECPVILRVGKLGSIGELAVVHAGLAPGVKLEKQDPLMVMNMRTMGDDGVPSDARDGQAWIQVWDRYQKSLPKEERMTVIYGHNSKRGLQKENYSLGIDTGCLKGGKLTAVVIESGRSDFTHRLIQVDCTDGRAK